ncbi:hypothetical protein DCC81_12065 [Chitinophaga parva]|uniref:DNA replication protein DnaD n=1 Tax=Chitinophaga parva TaxID=2169414 RepID=A0A2T7BFI2_9BACT|nr:hypothetical protein [Chitinophaga parva]PUZ25042.1 hypothetical protein DCC81_12065 [Chitinophaga parva]
MKRKDDTLSNFIPINRKFFNHAFWKEERTFSKSEAWLDLCVSARFEESEATELIGGKLVSWTKGQLPASLRYLAERWKWSKNKVDDFLLLLEREGMICRLAVNGITILSLVNYSVYNGSGQQKGQQKGHANTTQHYISSNREDSEKDSKGDKRGTPGGQQGDKTNIENKVKKEEINTGTDVPVGVPTGTLDKFKAFQDWIKTNAPRVAQMKEQLTLQQYVALHQKVSKDQLKNLLLSMHNYEPLLRKNRSVYLTIINWSKRDYNQEIPVKNGPGPAKSTEQYLAERKKQEEHTLRPPER